MVRVIVHTSVSVDGHVDGFQPDLSVHYGLAGRLGADVHLTGSATILAAGLTEDETDGDGAPPPPVDDARDERPLLAVVDSGGRVRCYDALLAAPHWRDRAVALCSASTPPSHLEHLRRRHVEPLVAGRDRVDLAAALDRLEREHHATRVLVDSGGRLTGALLRAGLVDELSLVVHPCIAGSRPPVRPPVTDGAVVLALRSVAPQAGGLVWQRYDVVGPTTPVSGDG